MLEENFVLTQLPSFSNNLSKRVVKSRKVFINDVGLASRLQGWRELDPLIVSPQFGSLFETLVFTEILRTRDHFQKRWNLYYWRTKQTEELDFIVEDETGKRIALDAKVTGQNIQAPEFQKHVQMGTLYVVTLSDHELRLGPNCLQITIKNLASLLLSELR